MPTITKCFSALVASGNGDRCEALKAILRKNMLLIDESTGKSRVWIHKYGYEKYKKQHMEFRQDLADDMVSLYDDVPEILLERKFPCNIVIGDSEWKKELEQYHFSDILEFAMKNGKWNGSIGSS